MMDIHNSLMSIHVGLGAFAVLAGIIALSARKGKAAHIRAGRAFALAMGTSSLLGSILGVLDFERLYITIHAGILGVTLISSGWLAARAAYGGFNFLAAMVAAINLVNAGALIAAGLYARGEPSGIFYGFPFEDYFFLSAMAVGAALGDARLFFRPNISHRHRRARHLWRMCVGFFIAAGSAFTGPGADAFPQIVRNSGVLAVPELLILALMLFWLLRTLFFPPAKDSS